MDLEKRFEQLKEQRETRDESTGTIVGKCYTFCPEFESIDRQLRKDINKFEIVPIKKYQRSAAGKTKAFPEDIRPINILYDVTTYLLSILNPVEAEKVYENCTFRESFKTLYKDLEFTYELYKFIEDRLRAVKLDIAAQSASCDTTIVILERIVRFYIVFNHLIYSYHEFDLYLHFNQLSRTLADLVEIYRKRSIKSTEFSNYYILTNIKDPELFDVNGIFDKSLSNEMLIAYHQKNYNTIFKIFKQFDYLSKCLFLPHLLELSERCVKTIKNTVTDIISVEFLINYIPISPDEIILLIDKHCIEMSNNMLDLKNKVNKTKEYQITRSKNYLFESLQVLDIESLLYNGQIDLNIRNYILKDYARVTIERSNVQDFCSNATIDNTKILTDQKIVPQKKKGKRPKLKQESNLTHCKPDKNLNIDHIATKKIVNIQEKINSAKILLIEHYARYLILKLLCKKIHLRLIRQHLLLWKSISYDDIQVLLIDSKRTYENIELFNEKNIKIKNISLAEFNDTDPSDYNFLIFIVEDKNMQNAIRSKNKMYNIFVGTKEEFKQRLEDKTFITAVQNSKPVIHKKLFDMIKNKSRNEVTNILYRLKENKRNTPMIAKNTVLHLSHRKMIDCDIYFECNELQE